MKIIEVTEVKRGIGAVNDLLKAGWELVHVIGQDSGVVYVLGKREEVSAELPAKKK